MFRITRFLIRTRMPLWFHVLFADACVYDELSICMAFQLDDGNSQSGPFTRPDFNPISSKALPRSGHSFSSAKLILRRFFLHIHYSFDAFVVCNVTIFNYIFYFAFFCRQFAYILLGIFSTVNVHCTCLITFVGEGFAEKSELIRTQSTTITAPMQIMRLVSVAH